MPKQPLTLGTRTLRRRAGQGTPLQPGQMPAAPSPRGREGLASLTRPLGTEDPQPPAADSPPLAARVGSPGGHLVVSSCRPRPPTPPQHSPGPMSQAAWDLPTAA